MLLKWLALRDSNPRLADYEPAVLTAELRAGKLRGHVGKGTWGTPERLRGEEARWIREIPRVGKMVVRGGIEPTSSGS